MSIEILLVPSDIRFMHDRINSKFSNGVLVHNVIAKIERGEMDVYDLPKIRVVCIQGYFFAFDNRRLYVYRVLHYRGKLDQVKVKLVSLNCFQPERFSTKNNGESVVLQRGITLPHFKPKSSSLLNDFDNYGYDDQNDYEESNHHEDDDDNDCEKNINGENNMNNNEENSFVHDDDDDDDCGGEDYHEEFIHNDYDDGNDNGVDYHEESINDDDNDDNDGEFADSDGGIHILADHVFSIFLFLLYYFMFFSFFLFYFWKNRNKRY